jgi:hypothetical protein
LGGVGQHRTPPPEAEAAQSHFALTHSCAPFLAADPMFRVMCNSMWSK